jgi:phosphoglycolate phosphatase
MTYKAAIFDLDGTLVNSLSDLTDATNYALKKFGQPGHKAEKIKKMIGEGTRTLISRALPNNQQQLIEQVLIEMRKRYKQIYVNKSRPYKGIKRVVGELKKRKVKLAVLTNKDQKIARKIVRHFFGSQFQIIKGTADAVPVKPEPKTALQILKKLKVRPKDTLFIGDSNIDVLTARKARINMVAVSWGFKTKKELAKAGAKNIVDLPNQLLKLFDSPPRQLQIAIEYVKNGQGKMMAYGKSEP